MSWGPVRAVWGKELRDTVRDRRTLLVMILMPVLITPLLIVGSGSLMKAQIDAARKAKKTCLLIGTDKTPELEKAIEALPNMEFQRVVDAGQAAEKVRQGEAHVAVIVPDDVSEKLAKGERATIEIDFKGTQMQSVNASRDVKDQIDSYAKERVKARLKAKGVQEGEIDPILVEPKNMSTPKEMGGFLMGFIVPMLVVMWSIVGGMYTAMDVSAGEKERNTLESLMLTPASRLEVTLGKLLAVSTVGFFTMVAALGSMYVAFATFDFPLVGAAGAEGATVSAKAALRLQLSPLATLLMLGLSMLLVITFSSLMVGLGIFAHSVKEAQNLIMPLYIFVLIPILIATFVTADAPSVALFATPVVNVVLLLKELLKNQFVVSHILITAGTLAACCVVAIGFTLAVFRRETVLFKS